MAKPIITKSEELTHLLARSCKTASFRRAGIQFSAQWAAYPLADIDPERLKRIRDEEMIESKLVTEDEARSFIDGTKLDTVDVIALRRAYKDMEKRALDAEQQLATLKASLVGDAPPKKLEDVPGTDKSPLPLPPLPIR
jgi:hypothetical protein